MNKSVALAFLVFLPVTLLAQAPPPPSKQLDKLKPLAGHWQGTGTAVMQPGQPPSPWTCESTYEWVLGGYWLQCDTSIRIEGMPGAMRFRDYMGWDAETERFVDLTVNNMGEVMMWPMQFVGEDKLVTMVCMQRMGQLEAERSVTQFGKDEMSLAITFLGVEGMPTAGVQGKMHRVAKASPEPVDACHAMMPVAEPMAKIARMRGVFDVQGTMTMVPGEPAMKITGRDVAQTLFDGAILQVVTKGAAEGDPAAYEAHGYYGWNVAESCYTCIMVSDMGEAGVTQCRFVGDDKFVATYGGTMNKVPLITRTVAELDATGAIQTVVAHSCIGTEPPFESFRASYKRVK